MGYPVLLDRISERPDYMVLPDEIIEFLRTPLAGNDLISSG
jgi:hypothetical protein|tara:strand:+ start:131 stop:253 length:123 start_codon:yes stop_codon:yes gene_type:complete